jgi:two-component system chemotaxis sensor kinase CheA
MTGDRRRARAAALVARFRVVARERLARVESAFHALELDPSDRAAANVLAGEVHTLKGEAGLLGLGHVAAAAHCTEDALFRARDLGFAPPAELAAAVRAGLDLVRSLLDRGAGDGADSAADLAAYDARVAAALAATAPPAGGPASAASLDATHGGRAAVSAFDPARGVLGSAADEPRLVPLDTLFAGFSGAVHDLARALGKAARLETSGGELVAERRTLDHLAVAVLHLVRNAVDHGLEPPDLRARLGKPEVGTVRLAARRAGSAVELRVADDGRGVDRSAVRAAAVARGLVSPERAAALTDGDALRLVLEPGLTTRAAATVVSGRGVGLDAVRGAIEALGGSISIVSEPGRGTTVTLRVPLDLPPAAAPPTEP